MTRVISLGAIRITLSIWVWNDWDTLKGLKDGPVVLSVTGEIIKGEVAIEKSPVEIKMKVSVSNHKIYMNTLV